MKIREATKLDAAGLLHLFSRLDSETDYMLFDPEERQITLPKQEAILESFSHDQRSVYLVAESDGIEAFCVIVPGKQKRNRHVASLVIGVQRSSWSRKVGSGLMAHALEKAKKVGITRVELTVRVDNLSAIALYQKFGFVHEGERVGSLFVEGSLKNEYYMARVE